MTKRKVSTFVLQWASSSVNTTDLSYLRAILRASLKSRYGLSVVSLPMKFLSVRASFQKVFLQRMMLFGSWLVGHKPLGQTFSPVEQKKFDNLRTVFWRLVFFSQNRVLTQNFEKRKEKCTFPLSDCDHQSNGHRSTASSSHRATRNFRDRSVAQWTPTIRLWILILT